jgi:hypothetical protein
MEILAKVVVEESDDGMALKGELDFWGTVSGGCGRVRCGEEMDFV